MRKLEGKEKQEAIGYFKKAKEIAMKSTCERSKCGAMIIKDGKIIGEGFNSPPNNSEEQRRCSMEKSSYNNKITDKTCCIHAEQRAIFDSLRKNPEEIRESIIYFVRLKKEKISKAGKPYCTICSKMSLDVGINKFVPWHEEGIYSYDTSEYNDLSFQYSQ